MRFVHARRWAAAAALAALAVAGVRHHFAHGHVLQPGDRLSALALSSLTGARVRLIPEGRPQVINVFATWCPPCRDEMPQLSALAAQLQMHGVKFLGIDQQEEPAAVTAFAEQYALKYPLYIDRSNVTHDVLGARMIPTTIVIDASGVIRWKRSGPLTAHDMRSLIETARSTV